MSRIICLLSILLFISCGVFVAEGKETAFRHFTVDDGLPSNTVYDIYRDSKGFLWFCTDKGVARYNGLRFETFSTFNGLPDNEIFFAREDHYGRLWFATFNGVLCYYKNDTFHTPSNTPFLRGGRPGSFIRQILMQEDGNIVFTFYDQNEVIVVKEESLVRYDIRNLKSDLKTRGYNVPEIMPIAHTFLDSNILKIIMDNKLVGLDRRANILFVRGTQDSLIQRCSGSGEHWEYLYSWTAVFRAGGRGATLFKRLPALPDMPRSLQLSDYPPRILEHKGAVYFCTHIGLFVSDARRDTISFSNCLLEGLKVSSICADRMRSLWVGTLAGGVYCIPEDHAGYRLQKRAYPHEVAYATPVKSGILFAANDNSVYYASRDSITRLFDYRSFHGRPYNLADQPGYVLDSGRKLYAFHNFENLVFKDIFSGRRPVVYKDEHLSTGIKNLIANGSKVYLAARRNLMIVDYATMRPGDEISKQYSNAITSDSLNSSRLFCMEEDPNRTIWFSTIQGVFKVENDRAVRQTQLDGYKLKSFIFFQGKIVGLTHDNRLLIIDHQQTPVKVDTVASQNCIWEKILKLDNKRLLISTNNYYRCIEFSSTVTVRAIENEYLPLRAEAIACDGTFCYFFKGGNITSVHLTSLLSQVPPPVVSFSAVKTKAGVRRYMDTVKLSYDESRSLAVAFVVRSFGGKAVSSQYSISKDGTDSWINIRGDEINLNNPSFGEYVIKVRSKTLSSNYSEPVLLKLIITPPFWARWWFIALVVVAVTGAVTLLIRQRIAKLLHKRERENEAQVRFLKSEFKALNALMNPHFIFNTLNNVQSLVNRDDKRAANEYLRIFADLIRQNMHNVSNELIPLEKEINLVKNYLLLEKLRFKDHLHYEVNIDDSVDVTDVQVPPLLIQPLVENAIKHGILPLESAEGRVIVNVRAENDVMLIEVRDNGVGLNNSADPQNSSHISYGMDNIRKRIEQLSIILSAQITFSIDTVTYDSGQRWTVAAISMPLSETL